MASEDDKGAGTIAVNKNEVAECWLSSCNKETLSTAILIMLFSKRLDKCILKAGTQYANRLRCEKAVFQKMLHVFKIRRRRHGLA